MRNFYVNVLFLKVFITFTICQFFGVVSGKLLSYILELIARLGYCKLYFLTLRLSCMQYYTSIKHKL